ncbi:isochorismatase family protein [Candidatus Woesearchaeota archaeon]|nr:isochorismatase family protein [Candidatus Woesearchaeota archaeon]
MADLGVLVVHLQEHYRHDLVHPSGTCKQGYRAMHHVLKTAVAHEVPIVLSEQKAFGKTLHEITKDITYVVSTVDVWNAFAGEPEPSFGKANRLIIMGFNKYVCVHATAEGALRRGYHLVTAEDLLFHATMNDIVRYTRQDREERARLDAFYRENTRIYKTADELIEVEFRGH